MEKEANENINTNVRYWNYIWEQLKNKFPNSWIFVIIIPIVGFLCTPLLGDLLMASRNLKIICFGTGLTILIWVVIIFIINNSPQENTIKINKNGKDTFVSPASKDEIKSFLVFNDFSSFELWEKDVSFRIGLPKSARNLATKELNQDLIVKKYANWNKHPNQKDDRGYCGYDEQVPINLIDANAELKYKFIKSTYSELEEMGFIKDTLDILEQQCFEYYIPEFPEFAAYNQPVTGRKLMASPEYNICFVMIIYQRNEFRNKYIFDLGRYNNKNRISVYLDSQDYLCFRVIDKNHNAYVLRFKHNLFNKVYQYNFKFASHPSLSYMEVYINGLDVAKQSFNTFIPFQYEEGTTVFNGSNLYGKYCGKMKIYLADVHIIEDEKIHKLLTFDFHKTEYMYVSNGEIIVYKNDKETVNFHRR